MNEELLMDLADCGSPEQLLSVILRHHAAWTPPIDLDAFAASVGIVGIADLTVAGFVGALMTNEEKSEGTILVKKNERPTRRRFTIGHELGHFLIRSHQGNRQCTAQDLRETRRETLYQRQESEANRFAAGILMPRPIFERDLGRLGTADVSHIQTLGDLYEASLEATANRYLELTDDCCAILFSQHGVIRYAQRSRDFPALAVRKGDPLPAGCASLTMPQMPLRKPSGWSEADGSLWLHTRRGVRTPVVLEQGMRQKDGYQFTLLYIEPRDEEEEDEASSIDDSWAVRFRR